MQICELVHSNDFGNGSIQLKIVFLNRKVMDVKQKISFFRFNGNQKSEEKKHISYSLKHNWSYAIE